MIREMLRAAWDRVRGPKKPKPVPVPEPVIEPTQANDPPRAAFTVESR